MRDFATLFRGREDAHGFYYGLGGKKTGRGKRTAKAETLREPVTAELWKRHLTAKGLRLGICPMMPDARVGWCCMDVDFYDIGDYHEKLAAAVKKSGLPFVITRTKSGGAHMWLFFETPILAADALKIMADAVEKLGLAAVLGVSSDELALHLDFFPKNTDADDVNLWVNMPYYGEQCHCPGADGKQDLKLDEFIAYANERIVAADLLLKKAKEPTRKQGGERSPLPPCIEWMMQNKVGEGHRDKSLTHTAIVFKRAYGDDWEDKVREFNDDNMEPPMKRDEVNKTIRSVRSKQYEYMCDDMRQLYCDKTECKKRKYGVGRGEVDIPIDRIEKIDGETPTYIVILNDKRITVKPASLYNYQKFREAAFAVVDVFLPRISQADWEEILDIRLKQMEVTEVLDVAMRDRVIKEFQLWTHQGIVTEGLQEALDAAQAYYSGKAIIFRGDDFMNLVERKLKCDRDKAFIYMRQWGVVKMEDTGRELWCYPVNGPLWFDPHRKAQK